MQERRRHRRLKQRMMVKFGEEGLSHSGFTVDISPGGIFILSSVRPNLDARLHLQVFLDPKRFVYLEGTVRRHKVVPLELRQLAKGGFGVKLLPPQELLAEIAVASASNVEVHYATSDELRRAYSVELRYGGVFVPTDRTFPLEAEVTVTFYLDFADQSFRVTASVVQMASKGSSPGLALMFKQPKQFESLIRPHLA